MKLTRRITTLLLALIMVLSVSATAFAATPNFTGRMDDAETESVETEGIETPAHNYVNGFCTDCDAYEPATMVTEENYAGLGLRSGHVGYYAIGNAGQLYWFAEWAEEHSRDNAVLTKSITVNAGTVTASSAGMREWTPIGGCHNYFYGTFDGNNKTISGLYYNNKDGFESYYVGLVSMLGNTGVVKNVTISNSYLECFWHVGAIAGHNNGLISGCGNNATIKSERNAGGIAGVNMGTIELCGNAGNITITDQCVGGITGLHPLGTVRNCWNTGNISSDYYAAGGIAGFSGGNTEPNTNYMENCWSTGTVTCKGTTTGGGLIGNAYPNLVVRNCYTTGVPFGKDEEYPDITPIVENVETKTREQFASGEVAYLLGGVWGQNIDNGKTVQTVPVFSNATVYQIGTGIYSNDPNAHSHSYNNGFCTDCDAYEPAPLVTSDNYSQLGLSSGDVGCYAISNAGQLYWFAEWAESHSKDSAVLAKDITVNTGAVTASSKGLREWTPIAGCNNYFYGTFDGNNKTISGLYYNNKDGFEGYYVGLVSMLGNTGVVKNVTISNSYLECFWHVGAIAGHNDGLISGCGNNATIKSVRNAGGIVGANMGTIELCGNATNITATEYCAGGIVGMHMLGTIRNCWNTGNVKAGDGDAGGIAGIAANNPDTLSIVENCWSTGTVTCDGSTTAGGIVGMGSNAQVVRNCYTTSDIAIGKDDTKYPNITPIAENVETKTKEQFASGEVAYLLQKDLTTPVWGQNIDNGKTVQSVPIISSATVYQIELDNKGTVGYSNDPNAGGSGNTDSPSLNKDWQTGGRLPVAAYILVDDEPVFLAGAGFTLYADEACTQPIAVSGNGTHEGNPLYQVDPNGTVTEIFTDDSGQFTIGGLESGTYYLKQTTAPPGYSSDDDSIGVIPVTFSAKGELSYPSIDEDSPLVDENGKISFVPNRNHADTTQPTPDDAGNPDGTGSAGIYILIGILGLLAVAAAVLLIIKFRTRAAR